MSLFNPTFLLFLALLLLVSGLLLFYMDIKMREQNHKIKAIADLATTIAQSIKGGSASNNNVKCDVNLYKENIDLIQVSDDDDDHDEETDSDEDDDSSEEDDSSEDDENASDEEDNQENEEDQEQKKSNSHDPEPIKINIHDKGGSESDIKHVFLSQAQLSEAKEEEASSSELPVPVSVSQELGEVSALEVPEDSFKIVLSSELDYKKMSIQKLRQLVSEKGLAPSSDASKMKKPELLKLLEAE